MKNLKIMLFVLELLWGPVIYAETDSIQITPQQIGNLGIKLEKPQPAPQVPLFTAPAKVVVPPARELVVSTSQPGLIVKMNASVGDKVNKGDVMALINSPDLLSLQGNYLKAVGALKLASANYDRNKRLQMEGVIPKKNEQEAHNLYKAAVIDTNEAKQLLVIAGMNATDVKQLDESGKLASRISIRSPISGRIIERMATAGSRVDNLAPLFRIANLDELWLEINIPQEHIGDLKAGDLVQVENSPTEAVVKVIGQSVNPENQTIPARALIKTSPDIVRVGQKVTVQAARRNEQAAYLLPDAALIRNAGKTYIFIRTNGGFRASEVAVLGKQGNKATVSGDLRGDEEIAVENAVALKASWLGLGSEEE